MILFFFKVYCYNRVLIFLLLLGSTLNKCFKEYHFSQNSNAILNCEYMQATGGEEEGGAASSDMQATGVRRREGRLAQTCRATGVRRREGLLAQTCRLQG